MPRWQRIDTASPEDPVIADGRLLLGGSTGSERMAYTMSGSDLDRSVQPSYWVEGRFRVDTRVPYPGWFREPVELIIRFANGAQALGSTVNLYQDGVLVLSDRSFTIGASGTAVTWGENSTLSGGRSSWQYVATNRARLPGSTPHPRFAGVGKQLAFAPRPKDG